MIRLFLVISLFIAPYMGMHQEAYVEDVLVVVHESVESPELSRSDLLEIYTLRRGYWNDGSRISVADYKGSSEIRSAFYSDLDIRINAIKRIWLKEQFTGSSLPPKVVENVDEMVELISENPGTIGYIPRSGLTEELKVLREITIDQ